jgi:hypothetical protein
LIREILNEEMSKELQKSNWSGQLTEKQKQYAALDVVKSLELYGKLTTMEDLTVDLLATEAVAGKIVNVVASKGRLLSLSALGAIGKVKATPDHRWTCPLGITYRGVSGVNFTGRRVLLHVTEVFAPLLCLPFYKFGTKKASLADFGPTPFVIVLEFSMLRKHISSRVRLKQNGTTTCLPWIDDDITVLPIAVMNTATPTEPETLLLYSTLTHCSKKT